ncbi:hypothetical protein [Streptomyces sp. AS02]|uniref:hypothetical protein n=1 Tax=Streptomyces sp. AS02 TaxID=2938946 RepID=UPI0020215994|nr:hypothetical protein [Streptomyces sp. AS02]MCL8016913.1 hypothetical protein [Streptomyces sp. AS02]
MTTPRLARALTVFHAWWEDNDMWDGNELYLDLDTAKVHAAFSYEGDEYGHPEEDDDEDTARPDFSWEFGYGQWMLLDHGKDTLVRVSETTVYRQATPREIEQQDALMAAEKASRAMGPHMPLAMALEHEAAKRTANPKETTAR